MVDLINSFPGMCIGECELAFIPEHFCVAIFKVQTGIMSNMVAGSLLTRHTDNTNMGHKF